MRVAGNDGIRCADKHDMTLKLVAGSTRVDTNKAESPYKCLVANEPAPIVVNSPP